MLVTGQTGFTDAWLSPWLRLLGAQVTVPSLPPSTKPSQYALAGLAGLADDTDSRIGSIVDRSVVDEVVAAARPTVILHPAAQAPVSASHDDPADTFATNVAATANRLNAGRSAPDLRAIVSVTSDKCCENREWDWGHRESDPMGGHDPYSESKGCAELVTAAMRRSFFEQGGTVGVATARARNVIVGGARPTATPGRSLGSSSPWPTGGAGTPPGASSGTVRTRPPC